MNLSALDDLRARFRERTLSQASDLRAWAETRSPDDAAAVLMVHNLAGAAGTLGFADLHAAAAAVDDAFATGRAPSEETVARLLDAVDRLADTPR